MRFNPPPDWPPVPPGWKPPSGWQPDASWPPPPPDWQLWVDDEPASSRRGTLLVVGGVAAVLLVIAGLAVAVVATRETPSVTAAPSSPSTSASSAASAEDQIKAAVKGYEKAWNDMNFAGFKPIVCKRMREKKEFNEADFLTARQASETLNFSVQAVQVNGDKALATVKAEGGLTRNVPFVREGDGWKWCDS